MAIFTNTLYINLIMLNKWYNPSAAFDICLMAMLIIPSKKILVIMCPSTNVKWGILKWFCLFYACQISCKWVLLTYMLESVQVGCDTSLIHWTTCPQITLGLGRNNSVFGVGISTRVTIYYHNMVIYIYIHSTYNKCANSFKGLLRLQLYDMIIALSYPSGVCVWAHYIFLSALPVFLCWRGTVRFQGIMMIWIPCDFKTQRNFTYKTSHLISKWGSCTLGGI